MIPLKNPADKFSITPFGVKAALDIGKPIQIIDVREPFEYATGHIKGSVNIPLGRLEGSLEKINRSKELITICAHGVRSMKAAMFLDSKGYKVKSMTGGMAEW